MSGRSRTLQQLREMLRSGQYSLSRHALKRLVERNISPETLREAGGSAEVIEDYPDDKYTPSCLLLGFSAVGTPLHLHVSRSCNPTVRIITLYVPSSSDWDDFRHRRQRR